MREGLVLWVLWALVTVAAFSCSRVTVPAADPCGGCRGYVPRDNGNLLPADQWCPELSRRLTKQLGRPVDCSEPAP